MGMDKKGQKGKKVLKETLKGYANFSPSKEELDTVYDMKRKCFKIKEIARAIRRRDEYVSKIVKSNGWNRVGVDQVLTLRAAKGLSIKAIAKELGIRDRIVARVVNGAGESKLLRYAKPQCDGKRGRA